MNDQMRRAVFLDRDGVINRAIIRDGKPHPPRTLAELQIPEDVPAALGSLQAAGFILIGVTNQPDVARGIQKRAVVEAINHALMQRLPLREIRVCYHDDADHCDCRKPRAGLLLQAAAQYHIDLSASFMIGDRWKDIEAGYRAGCQTVLIDRQYAEAWSGALPDWRAPSLAAAVNWILATQAVNL